MSLINEALKRAKQAQQRQPALATGDAPLEPAVTTNPGQGPVPWTVGAIALLVVLVGAWCISVWWRTPSPVPVAPAGSKLAARDAKSSAPTLPASSAARATAQPAGGAAKLAPAAGLASSAGSAKGSSELAGSARDSRSSVTNPIAQKTSLAASDKPAAAPAGSTPTADKVASAESDSSLRTPELNHLEGTPAAEREISAARRSLPEAPPDPMFMSSFRLQGIFYRPVKATAMVNGAVLFLGDELNGARLVALESQSIGLLWHGRTNVLYLK